MLELITKHQQIFFFHSRNGLNNNSWSVGANPKARNHCTRQAEI